MEWYVPRTPKCRPAAPQGPSETAMPIQPDRYVSTRKAPNLDTQTNSKKFEEIFVVHLDAAYDLAHWLTRDKRNAEDVVQEACLRAFKFIDSFHGGNSRAWLLAIVTQHLLHVAREEPHRDAERAVRR